MKINNKGYASTIIMFSILTLFLISMLMLVKTMNNSSSLNKKITEKVVDNIDYDASGSVQDRLSELENKLNNMETSLLDKMYPVGSIYISTTDNTIEQVQERFPNTKWEKYSEGRTLIGEGTVTDNSGNIVIYANNQTGGDVSKNITLNVNNLPAHTHTYSKSNTATNSHALTISEMPSHEHEVFSPAGHRWASGFNYGGALSHDIGANFVINPDHVNSSVYYGGRTLYAAATGGNGGHTHNITLTNNNTSSVGSSTPLNIDVQNPYIVTYMYKRIQ